MLVYCEIRGKALDLYRYIEADFGIRFKNMSDKEWDQIAEVHLKGAFACTKAAWPIFRKKKFGRVINTASAAGLYGMLALRGVIKKADDDAKGILVKQTTVLLRWHLSALLRLLPVKAPSITSSPLPLHP